MLDTKQFLSAIHQIAEEKGISKDKIMETIELAIAAAYKKDYGEKSQIIKAKLDPETGDVGINQIKLVIEAVDEEGYIVGEIPQHHYTDERVERRRDDRAPETPMPAEGEE